MAEGDSSLRLLGPVFLAGGAFKTALHGRLPTDLDLWSVSEDARQSLLAALTAAGAVVTKANPPYQTVLRAGSHVDEVAWTCEPTVLGERLQRADLGLAAVGVEWDAGRLRAESTRWPPRPPPPARCGSWRGRTSSS